METKANIVSNIYISTTKKSQSTWNLQSYKTSLHYYSSKIKSIHVSIFDMFDNKVDLMCMHWVHQLADSSFYNAIQEC